MVYRGEGTIQTHNHRGGPSNWYSNLLHLTERMDTNPWRKIVVPTSFVGGN